MNFLKYGVAVMAVVVLSGCSYFDTGRGEVIEVTSDDMTANVVPIYDTHYEDAVYHSTKGAVEVYNLDKSDSGAVGYFESFARPLETKSPSVIEVNSSVDIYPIDIPMQKTLQP
ncbi:MAG: hypothetical protein AB8B83_02545 [Bdellovibrionales bacterium]